MMIHHSNLSRLTSALANHTPLIIDADGMKTSPFAVYGFESISVRNSQIAEFRGVVEI
jgi:hypothetical protein